MATPHTLQITAAAVDPALLDLPWDVPLEEWPADRLAALPRGISRHVVRFVLMSGEVLAAKEISEELASREFALLRLLRRLGLPAVEPVGVVTGRRAADGTPLDPVLLTRHLRFSLPYRALFSQKLRDDTATRLVDALAVLLVRLHLAGFYWGDVSLSNTLFRRDAGAFAAHIVDVETGYVHDTLSPGQREHDLDLARTNIAGELMDLAAGDLLDPDIDPIELSDVIVSRYRALWVELTEPESFEPGERWRVDERIRRLNELGFDVGELNISTDVNGTSIQIEPIVVEAGHHSRRLLRLTGLDVGENQARRLLNDIASFRAALGRLDGGKLPAEVVAAYRWRTEIFDASIAAVPPSMRGKREPAEIFHELLEHRWLMSERAGREVSTADAIDDYVATALPLESDERTLTTDDPLGSA